MHFKVPSFPIKIGLKSFKKKKKKNRKNNESKLSTDEKTDLG